MKKEKTNQNEQLCEKCEDVNLGYLNFHSNYRQTPMYLYLRLSDRVMHIFRQIL